MQGVVVHLGTTAVERVRVAVRDAHGAKGRGSSAPGWLSIIPSMPATILGASVCSRLQVPSVNAVDQRPEPCLIPRGNRFPAIDAP
jgi:hypothetical protein